MLTQYSFERYFFGQRLTQLQFGEHRRFVQPTAQVYRKQAEYTPHQERDPPRVVRHFSRGINRIDRGSHERAQQNARCQPAGQRAAGIAHVTRGDVLCNKHPCPRHFATNGCTLNNAHQQQQNRRPHANLFIGRQQAHDQRRHRHHKDAQGEHLLTPQQIAEVRHDNATQRPGKVASGENAEGLHQAQPLGHIRREK